MRMEGQGWGDMGPVEEVKVLLRPPTSDRADCSRPSPLLVSDGGFQGGATPNLAETILGPRAVMQGGSGSPGPLPKEPQLRGAVPASDP